LTEIVLPILEETPTLNEFHLTSNAFMSIQNDISCSIIVYLTYEDVPSLEIKISIMEFDRNSNIKLEGNWV